MSRAITDAWIEKLFGHMAALWGSRFADMWRDCDLDEVKAMWRKGLANQSDEALKRGVAALFHAKYPPTLPEFIALCEPPPAMHRPAGLALTDDSTRTPSPEARAQLAAIAKRIGMREPGIAWARRTVDDAQNGRVLPGNRLQVALDALSTWEATHGVMRGREPGCDDEDFVADAAITGVSHELRE